MAEQLAAAHVQNKHLRAALEERDHTISQLRRENQELSETVTALQAQTLREQEVALNSTVRGPRRREAAHLPPLTRLRADRGGRGRNSWQVRCGARGERGYVAAGTLISVRSVGRGPARISLVLDGFAKEVGPGAVRAGAGTHRGGEGRPRARWAGRVPLVGAP